MNDSKNVKLLIKICIGIILIIVIVLIVQTVLKRKHEKEAFEARLEWQSQNSLEDNELYEQSIDEFKNNTDNIISDDVLDINSFEMMEIDDETMATAYFYRYKNELLENPEKAYKELNEDYRNKRFVNYENYKKYIENNIEYICDIKLEKFAVNNYNDYNEYICDDQYRQLLYF